MYKGINNALTFDTETTISNKGNFADKRNKLVVAGFRNLDGTVTQIWDIDHEVPVDRIQEYVNDHEWIVGFNLKFDLHWLLNIGIKFSPYHKLWDCQLFEYSKYYQRKKYISLQETCESYGMQGKIDIIKRDYWEAVPPIDTDQIPRDILGEYLDRDVEETYGVLQAQLAYKPDGNRPRWFNTFRRDCSDLWTVIEMERAGSLMDVAGVMRELEAQQVRKQELIQSVLRYAPDGLTINLNSNDHLSCLLYGGTIVEEVRLPVGFYKTGPKTGEPRYKIHLYEHVLPKRFEPVRGSEMKKVGYWSTSEDNLLKIKAKKEGRQLLDNIIEIGKIEKLIGSYLVKMPRMLEEFQWEGNVLHATYNHGITLTSRIASDKPNAQNFPPVFKKYIVSRFA